MTQKEILPRIVIALGGNALGKTPEEQKEKVIFASKALVDLISQENGIIVSHGNGP
jgi:carbamate kinase